MEREKHSIFAWHFCFKSLTKSPMSLYWILTKNLRNLLLLKRYLWLKKDDPGACGTDARCITLTVTGSMSGKPLQLQVIYTWKTEGTFHQKFVKARDLFSYKTKTIGVMKKRLHDLMIIFCYLTLKKCHKQTMEL